jgi:hypothetical protein
LCDGRLYAHVDGQLVEEKSCFGFCGMGFRVDGSLVVSKNKAAVPSPEMLSSHPCHHPSHSSSGVSCGVKYWRELASCHHPQRRVTFADGWAQGPPLAGVGQGSMGVPTPFWTNHPIRPNTDGWAPGGVVFFRTTCNVTAVSNRECHVLLVFSPPGEKDDVWARMLDSTSHTRPRDHLIKTGA